MIDAFRAMGIAACAAAVWCATPPGLGGANAAEFATAWSTGKAETKARLLAGDAPSQSASKLVTAAIEITLAPGWKTYWKFPGDAGGVPPLFDWAKSENLKSAKVLFPAPSRITDKTGDLLGYTDAVILPVAIEPADASKPVALRLTAEYGVCRDICIPVSAELSLDVPASGRLALPAAVATALEKVPRAADHRRKDDPKLLKAEAKLDGDKPTLAIDAEFPGGASKADVYVESPDGYYIPLPKAQSAKELGGGRLRFEIDLTGAVELQQIRGKLATVTMVSERGLSEATFKIE